MKNPTKEQVTRWNKTWNQKHKDKRKKYNEERRAKIKKWYREYLEKCFCVRCYAGNPVVLEFHHNNPQEKETEISRAVHNVWSIERIKKELKKCTCYCKNCHALLHEDLNLKKNEKSSIISYEGKKGET